MTAIDKVRAFLQRYMQEGEEFTGPLLANALGLSTGAVGGALARFRTDGAVETRGHCRPERHVLVSLEALTTPVRQIRAPRPTPSPRQAAPMSMPEMAETLLEIAARVEAGSIDLATVPDEALLQEVQRRMLVPR